MDSLCPLLGHFFMKSITYRSNDHAESLYESELWVAGYDGYTEICGLRPDHDQIPIDLGWELARVGAQAVTG